MKKILLFITMLALTLGAMAQPPRGGHDPHHDPFEKQGDSRHDRHDGHYNDRDRHDSRHDPRHEPRHNPHQGSRVSPRSRHAHFEPARPKDIPCTYEWQELWNGCHVRLSEFRVNILDRDGSRVVSGEEVVLLGNGSYLVRNGDIWRIYDWRGGFTTISGHEIHLWPNGLYLVRFSSSWRVFNPRGDRLTNVWGDRVELMANGLIRCKRAGRYFYYDEAGNERR